MGDVGQIANLPMHCRAVWQIGNLPHADRPFDAPGGLRYPRDTRRVAGQTHEGLSSER